MQLTSLPRRSLLGRERDVSMSPVETVVLGLRYPPCADQTLLAIQRNGHRQGSCGSRSKVGPAASAVEPRFPLDHDPRPFSTFHPAAFDVLPVARDAAKEKKKKKKNSHPVPARASR